MHICGKNYKGKHKLEELPLPPRRSGVVPLPVHDDKNSALPINKKETRCSSETYEVNKVSKTGTVTVKKSSIIGTQLLSSHESEQTTELHSYDQETNIKVEAVQPKPKQNGQIATLTEQSNSTQLSQIEERDHIQVSQKTSNAQATIVSETPNHEEFVKTEDRDQTQVSQKTPNPQATIVSETPSHEQASPHREKERDTHVDQKTQEVQTATVSQISNREQVSKIEEENHTQVSQKIQNVQIAATSEISKREQVSKTEERNHEVPEKIQNSQTATTSEISNHEQVSQAVEPNHTQVSQKIENVQIATTSEISNREQVSKTEERNHKVPEKIQNSQTTTSSEISNHEQVSQAVDTNHTQVSEATQTIQTATVSITSNHEHVSKTEQENHTQVSQKTHNVQTVQNAQISTAVEETNDIQVSQNAQSVEAPEANTVHTQGSQINQPDGGNKNKETQGKKSQAPQPPRQTTNEDQTSKSTNQNGLSSTGKDVTMVTVEDLNIEDVASPTKRRSGLVPIPVNYDEDAQSKLPHYRKTPDDEALIRDAIERNDFLNKIISGKRLDDVVNAMYNKEISAKETVVKQGEKGSHMYISAKGRYQILIKNKMVSEFNDVRVFGELALLYNAKRLATIKAVTPGRVWVLDRNVYQQITVGYNIRKQEETMQFLMNNEKLRVVGKDALQEVSGLLKSEFFKAGTQIVRQGDKGNKFYIINAGTVTITKDGEEVVGGLFKKGDCFGELALLKEDCRQATVTANAPGVECLTLTRKEFVDHFGELQDWEYISVRSQDSIKEGVTEHEDIDLRDLKIIKTLGVGGFGRVELVQHKKKSDLVFALKYLKKIDIVMQHQQEHVYNEKNIQMACKTPFIVRLYRTYKDNKYIYLLMESCLGGDLWSLLQKQKLRRFEEKEARFIAACVLESFDYLHSRGIIYRDLKPENLLIAANGYIKLTDFGFAKKISARGKTFTFAGTPEYVAPEIVLNRGHDRSVDYWAFGAFIFELLTGRTPFRTDDSSHMKTYNKILNGIDNVQFPSYVNLKARHIVEKLCRPVPSERLGMQKQGIKAIKEHKWFLGFEWQKFAKCELSSPFKPKLKGQVDTQYFDQFKRDTDIPPDEVSGWDTQF